MFERRVPIDLDTPCVLWTKRLSRGYGVIDKALAHRVAYLEQVGPIPAGYHIHHLCSTRACVNVQHLQALSPDEHPRVHGWASKQACIHGHPFDEANTYRRPSGRGKRQCRTCTNAASSRNKKLKRALKRAVA